MGEGWEGRAGMDERRYVELLVWEGMEGMYG
jgi:hypothetical protein